MSANLFLTMIYRRGFGQLAVRLLYYVATMLMNVCPSSSTTRQDGEERQTSLWETPSLPPVGRVDECLPCTECDANDQFQ